MSLNERLGAAPSSGRRAGRVLVVLLVGMIGLGGIAAVAILHGPKLVSGQGSAGAPLRPAASGGHSALAAINLQPSEMAGWKATPHHQSQQPADTAAERQLLHCLGLRQLGRHQVATTHSPDYALGDMQANSSVTRYRSQHDVDSEVAAFRKPRALRCLKASLRADGSRGLPAGVHLGPARVRLISGPAGAPKNVIGDVQAEMTLVASGRRVIVYITDAFIAGHAIDAEVTIMTTGTPVSPKLRAQLVNRVADRASRF